jgi:hypothetical protein
MNVGSADPCSRSSQPIGVPERRTRSRSIVTPSPLIADSLTRRPAMLTARNVVVARRLQTAPVRLLTLLQ